MQLLYNDYFKEHDTRLYVNLENTNLESKIKEHRRYLLLNSETLGIDISYDQAPDRVAYDYYGDDLFYPIILELNNVSSVLTFNSTKLNNKVILPKPEAIAKIL